MTAHHRQELDQRLTTLTAQCGASCAFVLDTTAQAYGASTPLPDDWSTLVDEVVPLVVAATRDHPLRKGGHLHLMRSVEPPFAAAESFAGVYMVVLLFETPFVAAEVSALVRRALPEIEALTVALPPPDPTREARVAGLRTG
ncbi:MAG: hypothetical protein Q8S73_10375 [Deltaproteobacteria bacterium]|nr:hypothetical protein [Myxococcales bacterium]MDP3214498.1 hypothetical protein [Deltaproteobacteria bacterium]